MMASSGSDAKTILAALSHPLCEQQVLARLLVHLHSTAHTCETYREHAAQRGLQLTCLAASNDHIVFGCLMLDGAEPDKDPCS